MKAATVTRFIFRANSGAPRLRGILRCITTVIFALGLMSAPALLAQTAGEGGIQGTVTDSTGAAVPKATVVATNVATGIKTTQVSTSAGLYNIAPLLPGTYTVTAMANGFQKFKQENLDVQSLHLTGLNIALKVGSANTEVTVSSAPPALETTNATLGGTIESSEYMALPLLVSGNQQRDITQFSNLLPGAQLNPAGRSSVIGGTQARIGEEYLDGLPLTTISQQGDNRPIFNVVPLESISEVQVVTSGFSAEFQGIGLENYTMKSGGNQFHGTVADFIRNTLFDTWGFAAPWSTVINSKGVKGYQNQVGSKPVDHQNELSISFGGPLIIPHLFNGRKKLFFEGTYDKVHTRSAPTYSFDTIPTTLMRTGNFCELLSAANGGCGTSSAPNLQLYDPTTLICSGGNCTRSPIAGNIIPPGEISPISQYLQKFLPPVTNANLTSNYLGGIPNGYDNYLWGGRIDYEISPRDRLSIAGSDGRRHAVPYTSGSANLPPPYLAATLSTVVGDFASIEDSFTITPHLVNQLSLGYFYFGGPPTRNNTEGNPIYESTAAGITGLPVGQASDQFPGVTFGGTDGGTEWANPDTTSKTVSHTFDIVDNVTWLLGKHSLTMGIQLQDLMENLSSFNSYSSPVTYAYSSNDTAQENGTSYVTASSGFAYGSFLLGAVDSTSTNLQPFSDIGSRYHTIAPYVQDDYKITPKLTVNLGLRWDYLPPFHEALDRWTFLNAKATNPYTGNPGTLQFAGNYGGSGVSCGCTTPVNSYWKDFGPRVGFAYEADSKTVFRGSYAILYSHGGGTGGAGATATGQTGFSLPISFPANPAGANGNPAFYLNNSTGFQTLGIANTNFGGPGYALPSIPAPSAATQLNTGQVGNFVDGTGAFVRSKAGISYADPYYGDRTPTTYFYNFGFQRALTNSMTFTMNYAGTASHFLSGASNIRGLESGEVNPIYFALGAGGTVANPQYGAGLLTQAATPANVALAQAIMPGCCTVPYAGFTAAAQTTAGASYATIAQMLKWMPQYSGTTDTWGAYTANAAYNSLQASFAIRPTRGLTLNVNYTWSKELDDAGTIRSGYPIPAAYNMTGKAWAADRMDRSLSTLDSPQNLAAYGVWELPFGKGHIGGSHFLVRALAGGWTLSSILTYSSGYPLLVTSTACTSTSLPNQGTCMPDMNPNFTGPIMTSKWGTGITALTLGTKSYIRNGHVASSTLGYGANAGGTSAGAPCGSSVGPFCNSNPLMIGDAPRAGAYGLRSPGNFRLTSGLRRTFPIYKSVNFVFGVDVQNVTNSVTFGENVGNVSIPTGINASNYGTLNFASSDSRDFQFSGRINF
ncbi:MAG: TonB-dependent receptor [Acidobacteriaceae bacterium]